MDKELIIYENPDDKFFRFYNLTSKGKKLKIEIENKE